MPARFRVRPFADGLFARRSNGQVEWSGPDDRSPIETGERTFQWIRRFGATGLTRKGPEVTVRSTSPLGRFVLAFLEM